MQKSNTIHQASDKLFKLSMADITVATEFFNAHLPAHILEKIDLSSLKLEKQSFIDEAYKTTEADVVYSAKMGEKTAYLYLLCEQQSKVDLSLAFRLLVYTVRIMEAHHKQHPNDPLPLVYPMVVYTGDEPWTAPLDIFPLFGEAEDLARETLLKPYQLLDVNRTSDDELRQQELSGLVAFVLKYRKTADFAQFLKQLMPWVHQVEIHDPSGASLGRVVLKYVIDRSPEGDKDLLVQEAQHYLSQELTGEIMTIAQQWEREGLKKGMTIAQQWKQEGIEKGMAIAQQWKQEGIEKGMQQGLLEGEATILKRQLQRRFGELSFMCIQRISNADAQTLLEWSDKVLDAKTLDDVFN